jgi:hydroxyacylglutathione hydrolase
MGCGRIFEGTPELMFRSLGKLKQLPDTTQVFCGHEYTLANLHFAKLVEPDNTGIINKIEQIKAIREQNQPSLPSSLKEEKLLNPFLRCEDAGIIQAVESYAGQKLPHVIDVFANLREWKNKT